MEPQGVEAVHPTVRVCAVLWRAHDLIVSGKRRRIAAAVADAGFALCGPSSPELWRPGCDEALFAALNEWQRMAFGWGQPPLLAVFDEAKQPAERAELLLLAGQIAGWGLPIDLAPLLSIAPIAREVEAAVDGAFAVPNNGEEGLAEALRVAPLWARPLLEACSMPADAEVITFTPVPCVPEPSDGEPVPMTIQEYARAVAEAVRDEMIEMYRDLRNPAGINLDAIIASVPPRSARSSRECST